MSDKENDKSTSEDGAEQAPRAATLSIAPAMDMSFEAVTVPPPPVASAPLSIPRAPALPKENRPVAAAAPAKRKRSEDDVFSVFDVDSNTASDDIPVSVQTPAPAPAKPKSKLGTKSEEREQTRSKQFSIDPDLFNLSVGMFSNSQQAPLLAPDMSALTGLSEKPTTKSGSTSALDDLAFPAAPIAPLAPLDPAALTAPGQTSTEDKKSNGKTGLIVGIVVAVALAAAVFLFFTQKPSTSETGSTAQNTTASPEANNLDTRPNREAAPTDAPSRTGNTDTPKDQPAALAKPNPTTDTGSSPKDSADKPAVKTATGSDKPSGTETPDKPVEEEKVAAPANTQSLAEAMAAGLAGGAKPAAQPSGPEFNKSAAQSALGGAAGAASGCKAPGDPSGVARVSVTFAPSGRATRAVVGGPPFQGTATGQCVAAAFRGVSVPPFSGDAVTVSKSVTIR